MPCSAMPADVLVAVMTTAAITLLIYFSINVVNVNVTATLNPVRYQQDVLRTRQSLPHVKG
eukprot:356188-Chlamydomonas_euryale.AAC.6